MIPPSLEQDQLFIHCLGQLSLQVPRLRDALNRSDEHVVRNTAGELRNTMTLLGLPKLVRLSSEIEAGWHPGDSPEWQQHCYRYCDLIERIHYSIQQRLEGN